ncbi:alanine dehydrogenase [Candidatus Deferrimicrobium sp.]|uniref:alanine dehydrogenase n=1 Tax=Candidatus Deferrimicrobium sp. TaxID=3060586 RepID=UPI002ED1E4EA
MRIGIPRETKSGECRVAVTPSGVRALRDSGAGIVVETGAGTASGFEDREYRDAGATIVSTSPEAWSADLVVKVKEPLSSEYGFLSESSTLFTFLHLAAFPQLTEELLTRRVTAIAYETVVSCGALPILRPMSEVAGILSIQAGARGLEKGCGGRGVLLAGTDDFPPGDVTVLGAGVVGRNAARIAAAIGANVTILDVNPKKLSEAQGRCGGRARTILSTPEAIAGAVKETDLLVSTVLVAGERAPCLVTRKMIRSMRPGAVAVDIAIDQGGSLETSRPTTHAAPFFIEEGVVHYCVTNMPAAVPRTSTQGLMAATLPYLLSFSERGVIGALRSDEGLLAGLNTFNGHVTCEGVAKAFGKTFLTAKEAIR